MSLKGVVFIKLLIFEFIGFFSGFFHNFFLIFIEFKLQKRGFIFRRTRRGHVVRGVDVARGTHGCDAARKAMWQSCEAHSAPRWREGGADAWQGAGR